MKTVINLRMVGKLRIIKTAVKLRMTAKPIEDDDDDEDCVDVFKQALALSKFVARKKTRCTSQLPLFLSLVKQQLVRWKRKLRRSLLMKLPGKKHLKEGKTSVFRSRRKRMRSKESMRRSAREEKEKRRVQKRRKEWQVQKGNRKVNDDKVCMLVM